MADRIGTFGPDSLYGTEGADLIKGEGGDDLLVGYLGANTIYGGSGNDSINGYATAGGSYSFWNSGPTLAYGDDGNDFILGGNFDDTLSGGVGNDTLYGRDGNDSLEGAAGNDTLYGGDGNDSLVGGTGDDRILPDNGQDTIYGGDGNDQINGYLKPDGTWQFWTSLGPILGYGEDGDDFLYGSNAADSLYGGNGNDFVHGSIGNDLINGDVGNDTLYGGDGNDTLNGGLGSDSLYGGEGDDTYSIDSLSDYVFDSGGYDQAIVSVSWAKISSSIEKITYTNGANELPYWISALVSDGASGNNYDKLLGDPNTFYYVFPTTLPSYDKDTEHGLGYTAFNATQKANTQTALSYISTVSDIKFTPSNTADQPNTFAFALNTQIGSAGYAQYPSDKSTGSDVFLNNKDYNATLNPGTDGAQTLIHEIGHALGLKHPFDEKEADGDVAPLLTFKVMRTTPVGLKCPIRREIKIMF